jgi:hypothetical protein
MRSYRELWLWLGAAFLALFAAFIAIGLAYFTKEQYFSFYTSWEAWASVAAFYPSLYMLRMRNIWYTFPAMGRTEVPKHFC